jgi:hypothetical protein
MWTQPHSILALLLVSGDLGLLHAGASVVTTPQREWTGPRNLDIESPSFYAPLRSKANNNEKAVGKRSKTTSAGYGLAKVISDVGRPEPGLILEFVRILTCPDL